MKLGVIGGSGVYSIKGAAVIGEHAITTPFGDPSDRVFEMQLADSNSHDTVPTAGKTNASFLFLPRHGIGHRFSPSEVNYRANILALKQAGATHLLAVSAVGILADGIHPGDLVIPDQLFDRTKGIRPATFFGDGIVGHVSFGEPFCRRFSELAFAATRKVTDGWSKQAGCHFGGTYVCIEGPQFSTKAESRFYRNGLEATVIGMTAIPEAKLAREAGLHYAMLALATDYDCWNESEGEVTTEGVVAVVKENAAKANAVVLEVARTLGTLAPVSCACASAATSAVMTEKSKIPDLARLRLQDVLQD